MIFLNMVILDSTQKIESEANDAQTQYEVITSTWGPMLQIKDPLEIDAAIQEQKRKCDDLIEQKNNLISELQSDLKRMDQAYYDDLDKQVRNEFSLKLIGVFKPVACKQYRQISCAYCLPSLQNNFLNYEN
jgi:hypothetical protein